MPTNRESSDTIEIGRDYEYGPRYSDPRPLRRSSTSRSDEWVYYDSIPGQRGYYDDYRPRHKRPDVYDRPNRPESYQNDFYYDRWGPVTHSHGAQNQAVSLRPRARSPSPTRYDDERIVVAEKSRKLASETAPPHDSAAPPNRRRNSEPIPGLFQTVFDVNHPQDTSAHLELPITDDYEAELEYFCRLQRLGNFGAAEEYFRNNLEQQLRNPYVFVQYGQMLLDKGDYLAFEQLEAEAVFGKEDRPRPPPREEIVVAERTRSPPPRARSRSRSRSWSPRPRERRRTIVISRSPSPVANGRQERHARFEPDVRVVSRSRSRSVDRPRHYYYDRERDGERDRGRSPDRTAQSRETIADTDYDELELLRQNWRLMKSVCDIHTKGNYEDALTEAWYTIENFHFKAAIGSTEIQLVKLALQLCAHIDRVAPERYNSGLNEAARSWIEWSTLFKELVVQGRIWDFKDLSVSALAAFSDLPHFETEDSKRSLVDDWISEEGDESTNLALLDILLEPTQLRSIFPDEIKTRLEALITHCPTAMKSRSFIRWILASAADTLSGEAEDGDGLWLTYKNRTNEYPGIVWHRQDCFLPGVYVPPNTQNPGWAAPEPSLAVSQPIQLALNLAKELRDYKSQAACLKLLILQSEDPAQLFQDLASLQKSTQGDKEGHLETLLSSYLVCRDRPSKEKLLEELQQTEDWRDDMPLRDGMLYWSRDFIERALKRSLQGRRSTAKLRNPPGFYVGKGLPEEVEQFTWQNTEDLDFPPANVHPQYPQRRRDTAASSQSPNQTRGQQVIRPYPRPSNPYARQSPWPSTRSQSPHKGYDDASFDRREREELEAAREARHRELDQMWWNEEREIRDQQDREMRLRLEDAQQQGRRQEEINKIQAEQMAKKAAEFAKLEEEYKLAKEKQDRESKARQERETHERLERAEVSLRDQAERLRRTEDRAYQEWLEGRDKRLREKTRSRKVRHRIRNSVETVSKTSSDTYSSDSSRSSHDEDSDDDARPRNLHDIRSEPSGDEADHHDGDHIGNPQQNPCTDMVLYGVQIPTSSETHAAGSPLPRSPPSPHHAREAVDGRTDIRAAETRRELSKTARRTTKSSHSKGSRSRARRSSKEREVRDKYESDLEYPEDADGNLATGLRQRINRSSSRNTRASERKGNSVFKPTTASTGSLDPNDITLFVKGSGILAIGNARLAIKDGEEITIHTNGSEKNSRGGNKDPSSSVDQKTAVDTEEGGKPAKGRSAAQQFQSSFPPSGIPSPSLNGHLNLPPGWKMEQSQLQQPLSSPRRRRSPSISSLKQQNQAYARPPREIEVQVKSIDRTTVDEIAGGAIRSSSPAAQSLQREELDDLYESVQSIGVGERETSAQQEARQEREELGRAQLRDRVRAEDRRSSLDIPSRRSTEMTEEEKEGTEARTERPKDHLVRPSEAILRHAVPLMQKQKPAPENTQNYTQEKSGNLTQDPQVIYELDQTSPDTTRSNMEHAGRPRTHRSESQNLDELSSKEQNQRIASRPSHRPSRPSSIGASGSPRSYMYDSTGAYDVWERSRRMPRSSSRMLVESPPSDSNPPRASTRARSRPSSMQELDDIRPLSRRTSRLDYFPPPPPPSATVDRLQSPTKRQSLIIDADGRPHPIRTKSENTRSRPIDIGSGPHIVVRRGVSADGRRPTAESPAPVARSRSRPQSMTDPNIRHNHPSPDAGVTERLRVESWEKETEGVWRKKKAVSTLHEDPEEEDGQELPPPPSHRNEGENARPQTLLDPEQGISRSELNEAPSKVWRKRETDPADTRIDGH